MPKKEQSRSRRASSSTATRPAQKPPSRPLYGMQSLQKSAGGKSS